MNKGTKLLNISEGYLSNLKRKHINKVQKSFKISEPYLYVLGK
ncbi:hypothetical protein COSHB9_16880 [Companilactobacillus alimentarius]